MTKKVAAVLLAAVTVFAMGCFAKEPEQVVINVPQPVETPAQPTVAPAVVQTPEPLPTEPPAPAYVSPYTEKIAALQAKNKDCIGWISVPGTNIDKGIMYGDSWFYSNHNEEKKEIVSGAVYSHYSALTQNVVITAHNSRSSKTMFHELHHVQEVNLGKTNCAYKKCNTELDKNVLPDFSTVEGRTWDISVFGVDAQWEIWAMYEVKANESAKTLYYNTWYPSTKYAFQPKNASDVQEWIDYQLGRSDYSFGVSVTPEDQFMTLYTCGDNHDSDTAQSRLYLFLKQVNPVSTLYGAGGAESTAAAPQA